MTHNKTKQPGGHRAVSGGNGRSKAIIPRPEQLSSTDYLFDQEKRLLGILLTTPEQPELRKGLACIDDDFSPTNYVVYRAIMAQDGRPVTPATIADFLDEHGYLSEIGGEDYLYDLAATGATEYYGMAGTYAQAIHERGEKHRNMDRLQAAVEMGMAGDMDAARRVMAGHKQSNRRKRLSTTEIDEYLLSQSDDDEGNAQSCRAFFGADFVYCDSFGWMTWTGTHWTRDGAEAEVERAIIETLKHRRKLAVEAEREAIVRATKPTAANVRNVKFLLTSILNVSVNEFDKSPDHLNCKNGVVDLRTGEIEPHNQNQYFTYCLDVPYNPDTDTREWESWLLEAVGNNQEVADYLQLAMGYTATGHTSEECLFYIWGPPRAGKGTFSETLLAMFGHNPLAMETDFQTFTRDRSGDSNSADLAILKPARFVVASESGQREYLNAAKIKSLTGGNLTFCALKYRDHFSYKPQYTIWLSSNYGPRIDVDDAAAWSRLRVIKFPNSYLGKEDKGLKSRMKEPAMLEQVLAWVVTGAKKWYALGNSGLHTPAQVEADTQAARNELDHVGQWLEECTAKRVDGFVSNATLFESYSKWCNENGVTAKGLTGLTQSLKSKNYDAGVLGRVGTKKVRGCRGIVILAG